MVGIGERFFFIAGLDSFSRQRAIENIKSKILKDKPASINTLTFYSKEINLRKFKESVFTFSFDREKVIIIKGIDKLHSPVKKFLFDNISKIIAENYIIAEAEVDYYFFSRDKKVIKDNFFKFVLKKATVLKVYSKADFSTLEGFRRSVRKNDLASCLFILEELFRAQGRKNQIGPLILGVLIREFSYMRNPAVQRKYFSCLWDADRMIKEKGTDSRLVIEMLLVKLLSS